MTGGADANVCVCVCIRISVLSDHLQNKNDSGPEVYCQVGVKSGENMPKLKSWFIGKIGVDLTNLLRYVCMCLREMASVRVCVCEETKCVRNVCFLFSRARVH